MAALATMTLADGAATPVNHTFSPIGVKNAVATWQDQSTGIYIGFPTITLSLRAPTKTSKVNKVTAKVVFPIIDSTVITAPVKAYELLMNIETVLPDRASTADRANLLAFAKNFMASTAYTDMVKTLTAVW